MDELRALAPHAGGEAMRTIFVGGGTPSLLRVDLWARLLKALGELFDLSAIARGKGEFTVECNPESTTLELLHTLRAGGVDRISVGAQSFDDRHLVTLERHHRPENVARALELARTAGIPRQSIDLIFAIPGQTLESWSDDLRRALALKTTHLSCYNLTYEPNTAMTKRLALGEFTPIDDETEAQMFELTLSTLRAQGLERYEVSNFAQRGHESLHNLVYWRQGQWLAAGPSASGHALASARSHQGSARWKNVPRLGDYLASAGLSPVVDLELPDGLRLVRERVMMGLRLSEGLPTRELLSDLNTLAPTKVAKLTRCAERVRDRGHMTIADDRWTLSDPGFLYCDSIASELMGCV